MQPTECESQRSACVPHAHLEDKHQIKLAQAEHDALKGRDLHVLEAQDEKGRACDAVCEACHIRQLKIHTLNQLDEAVLRSGL